MTAAPAEPDEPVRPYDPHVQRLQRAAMLVTVIGFLAGNQWHRLVGTRATGVVVEQRPQARADGIEMVLPVVELSQPTPARLLAANEFMFSEPAVGSPVSGFLRGDQLVLDDLGNDVFRTLLGGALGLLVVTPLLLIAAFFRPNE